MTKLRSIVAAAAFLCALAVPGAATAAIAFVVSNVNMRAGPGTYYPVVAAIGAGNTVEVYGCLSDYSWCDASIGPSRGWVAAQYLEYVYEERRVLIPSYGPSIGLPIISFTFGNYWDRHYTGRRFYRERDRYRDFRRDRRDRRDDRRERIEDRPERIEGRPQRRDGRQEPRDNRRERIEDRPARRDAIEQRRGERRQERQEERRGARQDYRRCLNGGGTPETCGQ